MNLIKNAIEIAQEKDSVAFSTERIAEACAISSSSLSNYKAGIRTTPPEVIVSLSAYLHDLSIRDKYCTQECAIGRCKNPNGYTQRDLQTLGFMSGKSADELRNVFDMIYKFYSDGVCDRREQLIFVENVLPQLYPIVEVVRNLINLGEGYKSE